MNLKLRPSIILKPVNPNCVYALDCEDTENYFFKFEGVSKIFIESVYDGIEKSILQKKVEELFPMIKAKQIEEDLEDFIKTIQEHNLLSITP